MINVWSIFCSLIGYSRNLAAELLPDKPPYMLLGLKLVGSELHLTRDTDIAICIHIYIHTYLHTDIVIYIFSVEKNPVGAPN